MDKIGSSQISHKRTYEKAFNNPINRSSEDIQYFKPLSNEISHTKTIINTTLNRILFSTISKQQIYNIITNITGEGRNIIQAYLWIVVFRKDNYMLLPDNYAELYSFINTFNPVITTTSTTNNLLHPYNVANQELIDAFNKCKKLIFNTIMNHILYHNNIALRLNGLNKGNCILPLNHVDLIVWHRLNHLNKNDIYAVAIVAEETNFLMVCSFLQSNIQNNTFESFQNFATKEKITIKLADEKKAIRNNYKVLHRSLGDTVALFCKIDKKLVFCSYNEIFYANLEDLGLIDSNDINSIEQYVNKIAIDKEEFNIYKNAFIYIKNDLELFRTYTYQVARTNISKTTPGITLTDIHIAWERDSKSKIGKNSQYFIELLKTLLSSDLSNERIVQVFRYAILEKLKYWWGVDKIIMEAFLFAFSPAIMQNQTNLPRIDLQNTILDVMNKMSEITPEFFSLLIAASFTNPTQIIEKTNLKFKKSEITKIQQYTMLLSHNDSLCLKIHQIIINVFQNYTSNRTLTFLGGIHGSSRDPVHEFEREMFKLFTSAKSTEYKHNTVNLRNACLNACAMMLRGSYDQIYFYITPIDIFGKQSQIPDENISLLAGAAVKYLYFDIINNTTNQAINIRWLQRVNQQLAFHFSNYRDSFSLTRMKQTPEFVQLLIN